MKLEQLMEDVPFTLVQGTLETEIEDIIYDSRKAAPGLLFVCIVGTQRDSHDLAADCVAKGVNTLVIQHDIDLSAMPDVNVIKVESSRYAMAKMSANLFGNPSRQMTMIGVTGTKGKTTTTHMIKSVLEAAGRKVGMIGTNGIYFLGHHKETANTTPESYELQKTFRQFLDAGCDTALMEVSSQGLMMDRVAGIHFNVGVFTNLSPDHIGPGEHKTFEEYRGWKGPVVRNLATTHMLDKVAGSFGEACYEVPVGFKYISAKLDETDAVLGGESSGGLTVRGHIFGKDSIYASALFVEMISAMGKTPGEIYRELTERFGNHEMVEDNLRFRPEEKERIQRLLMVEKKVPDFGKKLDHCGYADGFKAYFADGSFLICRFSGTEPLLRIFAEDENAPAAARLIAVMKDFLKL